MRALDYNRMYDLIRRADTARTASLDGTADLARLHRLTAYVEHLEHAARGLANRLGTTHARVNADAVAIIASEVGEAATKKPHPARRVRKDRRAQGAIEAVSFGRIVEEERGLETENGDGIFTLTITGLPPGITWTSGMTVTIHPAQDAGSDHEPS